MNAKTPAAAPPEQPKPVEPPIKIAGLDAVAQSNVEVEEYKPTAEDLDRLKRAGGEIPRNLEPDQKSEFVPRSISVITEAEMAAGRAALARRNRVFSS